MASLPPNPLLPHHVVTLNPRGPIMKKAITLADVAVIARVALEHTSTLDTAKAAFENATKAYETKISDLKAALIKLEALPKIAALVRAIYPEYVNQRTKEGKAMYNRVDRLAKATGLYTANPSRKAAGKANAELGNTQNGKTANAKANKAPSNPVITAPVIDTPLAAGVNEPAKITGAKGATITVADKPSKLQIQATAGFIVGHWTDDQIADLVAQLGYDI